MKLAKIINLDEYRKRKRDKGKGGSKITDKGREYLRAHEKQEIDLEPFKINCKKCPIAKHCFWFIKMFKGRLCPFKRGER